MGVGCDEHGVCYAAALKQPWQCPNTDDTELAGWRWLEKMVSEICDEACTDIAYSADQMVDAYMAGAGAKAELVEVVRGICDMQAQNYGDAMRTHMALADLSNAARALLSRIDGEAGEVG
jgi:hypothetical protein